MTESENEQTGWRERLRQTLALMMPQWLKRLLRPWIPAITIAGFITLIVLLVWFAFQIIALGDQQPVFSLVIIFVFATIIVRLIPRPPVSEAPPQVNSFPVVKTIDAARLNEIYHWVIKEAESQIDWYSTSRQPKRSGSRLLRAMAIVFGTLGALIPVIASIFNQQQGNIIGWGYVFLAVAGACIAGDRLFGLSSGWIRYILTEFSLREMLTAFRYKWLLESDNTDLKQRLQTIMDFHSKVQKAVKQETETWALEFQTNLADLEKTIKASKEEIQHPEDLSSPA